MKGRIIRSVTVTALFLRGGLAQPVATLTVRIAPNLNTSNLTIPLEKYVAAVLAGESNTFRSDEALKAMAVAARTYAIYFRGRHAAEGYDLCGTTHCQRLDPAAVTPRIQALVDATAGELLWYEGKPIFTSYSQDCGGVTEDAGAVWSSTGVPYLRSHPDPYCTRSGPSLWQWAGDPFDIAAALHHSQLQAPHQLDRIAIAERTPSGRARVLALSGGGESIKVSASSFRFAMGRELGWNTVRSDRFDVTESNGRLLFQGAGGGHGVGMCQRGADQMGVESHTYREILAFYYPGTALGLTGRGISWARLGGEAAALFTTHPGQDGQVLALAERLIASLARRTGLPAPSAVELRLYPDIDTFRNATGQPGWVVAQTVGRRISLQPAGAHEPTLRHELLHVFFEAQANPSLPVWFREGLVGYFEGGRQQWIAPASSADATRARRDFADAARKVVGLVSRYGEVTVLGWLKIGLPREVSSSSTSTAATNSR
jgi:stage II sporulation protein D